MGCNPSYTQLWPGTSHQRPRNGWLRRWGDLWSSLRNQVLIQTSQPLFWYQLWRSLCEKWGGLDCAMYSHHCHTVILQMKHHGHWTVSLKSVTVVKFLLCVRVHVCLLTSVVSDSLWPMYLARQAPCPWGSPGKNTAIGCHVLLQGIFPTQGSNLHLLHLLHCRGIE